MSDPAKMSDPVKKGPWGQFAILTMAAIAVGCTGIFSQILAGYSEHSCPNDKSEAVAADSSVTDDHGSVALTNATGENSAISNAGIIALGSGIGIFVNALINKFMPGNGGGPLASTKSRMMMVMLIAVGMIVIGSISISSAPADTPEEQALQLQRQRHLGGIVLGFGIGLIVPALLKFLTEMGMSKLAGSENASDAASKMNRVGVAGGAVVLGLYSTVIGSWAWNNYNKCNKTTDGSMHGHMFATLNGISTIIAAVLTVYCAVYMFYKVRCKVGQPSRSCEIADTMASWGKMKSGVNTLAQRMKKK